MSLIGKSNGFNSVSPTRLRHNPLKENEQNSFNSINNESFKCSISTRQHTNNNKSLDNLYVLKLESRILEMQKKVDQQTYQIETLAEETENFMDLCEQQKLQLNSQNIEMLRQEYQDQITSLIEEKDKLTEHIYNLTQEYRAVEEEEEIQLATHKKKNMEITQRVEAALNRKEQLLSLVAEADRKHAENEKSILAQEQTIDSLRNIERKFYIALKDIQSLQNK